MPVVKVVLRAVSPGVSDTEIVDWLEAYVHENGSLVLHDGSPAFETSVVKGIVLRAGEVQRTLREVVAHAMSANGKAKL